MSERKSVLLTVSGRIPDDLAEQVAAGSRPRADYTVLAEAFNADLIDVSGALSSAGLVGRMLHRAGGPGLLLGWYCFRRRRHYEVIVTDGEHVGLPLALLCRVLGRRRARHMMIAHILSTSSKARLIRYAHLGGLIDRYVVYCSWQRDFIVAELSVPSDRVMLSTFMVDTKFFAPDQVSVAQERMICSAGLERRDYRTFLRAVDGLDVRVLFTAVSLWSKQSDSSAGVALPSNAEVRKLTLFELREMYARSRFVVMPLQNVEFQAGITTILEAMAMGRSVICTRAPGQTDTVMEGETGRYVAPGDAHELREAIVDLLGDDDRSRLMGDTARDWVVANADIEQYARRLAAEVESLRSGASV